jgi:Secretion system C-terminal sorting domain
MPGSVTVVVNPVPTISLSVSPYKNLYPGLITTLTATATSTANPITYFWFKNNTLINNTGSTLPVNILNLGDYKVAITDANGCVNQSQVITIADSSNSKLFIYPNPNSGQFTITYYNQGGLSTKQLITIYSSKGERVYNNVFVVNQPYQFLPIDLRRHGAGIYYVVLSDETGKKIKTSEVLVR